MKQYEEEGISKVASLNFTFELVTFDEKEQPEVKKKLETELPSKLN